ncbi:MAG TPA: glycosyltransferase family 39 protein [Gaiellaceae bacterium]|nr:glycosyltransferase family 39 protein [Gaiellaceae bacterium]
MSDVTVAVRPGAASRRLAWTRTAGVLVFGIVCVLVVLHVVWLVRFRRGYVTEWDESGYLQFSLSNFDDLHDHGFSTFARTVGSRGTFGPLLPFVTSLAYPIVGRGIFGSFLVLPLFFAGLVGATFGLARRLVSDSWAVVAALAVAAIPAVTDYTRLFHFALPATACMTAALWALVRSDGFRRPGWAAAFGLFVGLTLLSRTMTVAYLPGFALAAGTLFLVGASELRSRLRNLAIAVGTIGLVAGPWYIRNARSVYDLLVNSGYGEGATPFGRHYHVASWGYWTKELRLDLSYMWLPLAAALVGCFGAALAYLVARHPQLIRAGRPRSARAAAVLALVLVVLEGYLVLTSSRNEGTGFALPWIPALVILGVTAAASVPARTVRLALAGILVAVSLSAALSKSGWVEPLAKVRTVAVPGLGRVSLTDGRGIIQTEVAGDGYDIGRVTQPLPSMHRRWLPLARDVVGWSLRHAERRGQTLVLTLGLDDRIFANSRLILASQLWFHRFLPVDYLRPYPDGDKVAAYRRQLLSPQPVNALITGEPPTVTSITRKKVEAAARSLGFIRLKSFRMPDGRKIWIWWREPEHS